MLLMPPQPLFASSRVAALSGRVAGLLVAALAWPVAAEISWHGDLDAARAAAAVSGRPVLTLVLTSRSDSPPAQVFASAEVEAVVNACFEPVRIDTESRPDLAAQLGIERGPSVAVLDAASTVLARFDCPATSTEFVATVARAAQQAAIAQAGRPNSEAGLAPVGDVAGEFLHAADQDPAQTMTSKVRQLSNFAESQQPPLRDPGRFPMQGQPAAEQPQPSAFATPQLGSQPTLPTSPQAWPAEESVASAFDPIEPAPHRAATIEPAATAANSWLAGGPQPQQTAPNSQAAAQPPATAGGEATAATQAATASDLDAKPAPSTNWFLAAIQQPLTWLPGRSKKPAVEPPPEMPAARPQTPAAVVAGAAAAAPPAADSHGSMPLGLEGYCPVTIADRGMWVEGRAQWGVRHRGRTYLFAGPEQQQAFLTTPDRYAPALSGDDPVLAFDSGTAEPGRRAYGVTYQSRMYLFASPDTRAAFAADPARYTTRVQLAEGLPAPEAPRRF